MLTELVLNADVLNLLGTPVNKVMFRPSGWVIPDDTDTGISIEWSKYTAGAGYMEMDVKDVRTSTGHTYEMRGGYAAFGLQIGSFSKTQKWVDIIVKHLPKQIRPSSDFVVLPGGSITELIMGPLQFKKSLELADFQKSSWLYIHIGAEVLIASGDIGLMFMVDQDKWIEMGIELYSMNIAALLTTMMSNCLAWAPYYGVAIGLGAGGTAACRFIQTVDMKEKGSA